MPGRPGNVADRLRPLRRALRRVEVAQVRRFGRSVLSTLFRTPVLVLVTSGRRTGRTTETVLACHRLDDGRFVVVGGAGGQTRTPDWVANLRTHPDAAIVVGRRRITVCADELAGVERDQVWRQARDRWPRIEGYRARAARTIPVFVLTPVP